jgi:Ca2+:H+ antiporter
MTEIQRTTANSTSKPTPRNAGILNTLRTEWILPVALTTAGLFLVYGKGWLADLANPSWLTIVSLWLFVTILLASLAVVRHAEGLATLLSEPLGTLLLTLSVIGIEVAMISAVMASGHGNPTLARDAMFAVIMIVMNGMVGLALIVGGLRYHEQYYNFFGANAFLAVIVPLAVLGLVLPNFTHSSPGPTLSVLHAGFLILMSVALYGTFLAIQTSRHRNYFLEDDADESSVASADQPHAAEHEVRSPAYHTPFLLAYLVLVVLLAKKIAAPINYGIEVLHAPAALGGLLVSVIVLSPESMSAIRAALDNRMQRCVNLLLGSVLASISLTIPAALTIGFMTGQTIVLGLDPADMTLLVLTLAVSMLTFSGTHTNALLGAIHLLLFLAYLMLIIDK